MRGKFREERGDMRRNRARGGGGRILVGWLGRLKDCCRICRRGGQSDARRWNERRVTFVERFKLPSLLFHDEK